MTSAVDVATFTSEAELSALVRRFESGELPREEWHHAEHVAVAVYYLATLEPAQAEERIRQGIQALNARHGVAQTATSGYHETWTIFLARKLAQFLRAQPRRPLPELVSLAVDWLADFRGITRRHYSRELIMSWEARTSWREPDLEPL